MVKGAGSAAFAPFELANPWQFVPRIQGKPGWTGAREGDLQKEVASESIVLS